MSAIRDFNLIYTQPIRQEPKLYFSEFEAEYKGFKYRKETEQNLYYILCPEGRSLPYDLSGRYSKIKYLEESIDKWLEIYTIEELPLTPRPPRIHRKKEELKEPKLGDDE